MKRQQGVTLIGGLLSIIIVIFVAIMVMRAVPVYIENYQIVDSIKSLKSTPSSSLSESTEANVNILKENLWKRLDINQISDISKNAIGITPIDSKHYKVTLKYQKTRPFAYNIKLLFDFDNTYEVEVGN